MSIHVYIWLCIENEEEVSVELFFISISVEKIPTPLQLKASPSAFTTSLLF
jgi:hypothetical protein